MLQSLRVRNIALIDSSQVEFGEGLNIFTGETGAGKSLVIGALTIALGSRLPRDIVREGEKDADIELVFDPCNGDVLSTLEEADLGIGEEALIIRRHISQGRSISRLNDHAVTSAVLKKVTGSLIDIHGQHEHQKLLYGKEQLSILDSYASDRIGETAELYHQCYVNYRELCSKLEEESDPAERLRETDLLSFELEEIESAKLSAGEDIELEESFTRMNNSLKLTGYASEARGLLGGEDASAAETISRALKDLKDIAALDGNAEELMGQLTEIDALLGDLRKDLEGYIDGLSFSEEEFSQVQERLDLINRLKLKYGQSLEEIEAAAQKRRDRLKELVCYEENRRALKADLERNEKELARLGVGLTRIRKEAAAELEEKLKIELEALNFIEVSFKIDIASREGEYFENGMDQVNFLISTNPGEALKPLSQVASGGELSRVMLAIKTVLADSDKTDTLIFDEIDEGISGRTAQKVSESLVKLSRRHQVICITHLPQIAAMADHHFLIEKEVSGGRTHTELRELKEEEMVTELSRLLGGAEITEAVVENAREMKRMATERRSKL